MKKGTCKFFTGVSDDTCEKGVNYRQHVGGEDRGWITRLACFNKLDARRNGPQVACGAYEEPTSTEIQEWNTKIKRFRTGLMSAMVVIKEKHSVKTEFENPTNTNKDAKGTIECPVCGGVLHYTVASYNGHIWGQCETQGCLEWMQ